MVFDMCPGCGKEYDTIDEVFGCKCEPEKIENVFKPINDALSERDTRIATLQAKTAALVRLADTIILSEPMPSGEPAESVWLGRQQVADEIKAAIAAAEARA